MRKPLNPRFQLPDERDMTGARVDDLPVPVSKLVPVDETTGRRLNRPHGRRLVVIAAAIAVVLVYLKTATEYSIGSVTKPAPGSYPFVSGVILLVGLVLMAFDRRREPERQLVETIPITVALRVRRLVRPVVLVGACLAYILLLRYVGDTTAAAGLGFVILIAFGEAIWRAIPLAIGIAFLAHYLFVVLLGVPLGKGSTLW